MNTTKDAMILRFPVHGRHLGAHDFFVLVPGDKVAAIPGDSVEEKGLLLEREIAGIIECVAEQKFNEHRLEDICSALISAGFGCPQVCLGSDLHTSYPEYETVSRYQQPVERYQLGNCDKTPLTRVQIFALDEALFQRFIRPSYTDSDVASLKEYQAKHPTYTHLSFVMFRDPASLEWGSWACHRPGSLEELRPSPTNQHMVLRCVERFAPRTPEWATSPEFDDGPSLG